MRRFLTFLTAIGLASSAVVGVVPRAQAAIPFFTVQDLGTLPGDSASVAMGINTFGDVVGWSTGPSGTRAFLYRDATGMTVLPAPAGRPVTTARAINANGVVVGTASAGGTDIGHAVRWQGGVAKDLGTIGTGLFSEARGVNSTGAIVGTSYTDGGGLIGIHGFRYTDTTGLVDLTPGIDEAHAEGINDVGQVAGWRNGRAFRLAGATFTELGVPTGFARSFAFAINGAGTVAGYVSSATGNSERIFRYSNGTMTIIGGMGEYNRALGINGTGDVVGTGLPVLGLRQGFLYTDANGMQGLNQLIDPNAGWFVLGASGINDAGQVVGWASGPNGQRAVRLTPGTIAPKPPAAPTNLGAQALSGARVRLTWTDQAGTELGFRIERGSGSTGAFAAIGQVGPNTTTFVDSSTKTGRVYRYRVLAFNDAGSSAWSNIASVRTRR